MLQSGGVLGRWKYPGDRDRVSVPVYFSNPDLLWATDYPAPRFGQGAFAAALRELHQQVLRHNASLLQDPVTNAHLLFWELCGAIYVTVFVLRNLCNAKHLFSLTLVLAT